MIKNLNGYKIWQLKTGRKPERGKKAVLRNKDESRPAPAGLFTGIIPFRVRHRTLRLAEPLFGWLWIRSVAITEKEFSETLTKRISYAFPIPRIWTQTFAAGSARQPKKWFDFVRYLRYDWKLRAVASEIIEKNTGRSFWWWEHMFKSRKCPECGKGYVKTEKQILPAQWWYRILVLSGMIFRMCGFMLRNP